MADTIHNRLAPILLLHGGEHAYCFLCAFIVMMAPKHYNCKMAVWLSQELSLIYYNLWAVAKHSPWLHPKYLVIRRCFTKTCWRVDSTLLPQSKTVGVSTKLGTIFWRFCICMLRMFVNEKNSKPSIPRFHLAIRIIYCGILTILFRYCVSASRQTWAPPLIRSCLPCVVL